jgi:hypothetical protein
VLLFVHQSPDHSITLSARASSVGEMAVTYLKPQDAGCR